MKNIQFILICIIFSTGCTDSNTKEIDLSSIYNKYGVKGGFLLKSLNDDKVYIYNEEHCQKGYLPASTFKIVSSIIGLETGVATGINYAMPWDSVTRQMDAWNQDHTLATAFQASCVPCYRKLVEQIGVEQMQDYVRAFDYGRMDIQSNNLTDFWLLGNSRITPYEQLDFLTDFFKQKLQVKPSTYHVVNEIMILAQSPDGIIMKGKTGLSLIGKGQSGWFVGAIERPDGEKFVFVNHILASQDAISVEGFMQARKKIVGEVLKEMKVF